MGDDRSAHKISSPNRACRDVKRWQKLNASLIAQAVPMFTIVERVRSIRPVHLRHPIFALEEVWQCQRAKVQAIGCLWMPPNEDRPFGVQDRYMLGFDRQCTLRA